MSYLTPRLICRSLAATIGVLGGVVLMGWVVGIPELTLLLPGPVPMKADVALGFVLSAVTLWIGAGSQFPSVDNVGKAVSAMIVLLGLATIVEHIGNTDFGIDQLLVKNVTNPGDIHSGRMSAFTDASFILFGTARFVAGRRGRFFLAYFSGIAVFGTFTTFLSIIGYAYGVSALYNPLPSASTALQTAMGFAGLFAGLNLLRPDRGWVRLVWSRGAGGAMARRMLPAVAVGIPILGWVRLQGELAGYYDTRLGLAIFATANVVLLALTLWFAGQHADRLDDARRQADARLLELQAQMLRVSRLGEIGQMASSLAHELNQPLTAVVNFATAARLHLDAQDIPGAYSNITKVSQQGRRAGEIIHRIRSFVGRGDTEKAVEDVSLIVEEAILLATSGNPTAHVKIGQRIDAALPAVVADRVQVQQVLLNLIRNAMEAIDEQPHPELIVRATIDGAFVAISVSDNGPGLAPEIAAKLFETFNSTKETGMGVGLSICRTIVEAHGGRIWAAPNSRGGVTFAFTLPQAVVRQHAV